MSQLTHHRACELCGWECWTDSEATADQWLSGHKGWRHAVEPEGEAS